MPEMLNVAPEEMAPLDEANVHERQLKSDTKNNHCPFGCMTEELDDLGYCLHLAGFVNWEGTGTPFYARDDKGDRYLAGYSGVEGVEFEPVKPLLRFDAEGKGHHTGNWKVCGRRNKRQPLPTTVASDVLINPEYKQFDKMKNGHHLAKLWVSARVYRKAQEEEKTPKKK